MARPHRWRRRLLQLLVALIVLTVAAELIARFAFGLGDPPLMVADPDIEYLFKPSSHYRRFGNDITYNQWSMRSDDFPQHKADPKERRVLVMGDSVINGGALTDQRELATELLRSALERQRGGPVVVGNVSAGSWGPGNLLAYVKRFGLFDADVVVLVLSSHDLLDCPTHEPVVGVDPSFPDKRPTFALEEVVTRYLPRYLPQWLGGRHESPPPALTAEQTERLASQSLADLDELTGLVAKANATLIVAQHLERREVEGQPRSEHDRLLRWATDRRLTCVQLGPAFSRAIDAGEQPYRDNIHPNAVGQRLIAEALLDTVRTALEARDRKR